MIQSNNTLFNISESNKYNLTDIIELVYDVKLNRLNPYISMGTTVNNYSRNDSYDGKVENKYKNLKFINVSYEYKDLYDRFLTETLELMIQVDHYYLLNDFIDGLVFYKFEIPEVYEYKLRKIKRIVGCDASIDVIIDRVALNKHHKYSKPKYDKYNINKLLYNLNEKYELEYSINRLLRDYIIKTIDCTQSDNLYPNPFKIRKVRDYQLFRSKYSSFTFDNMYMHEIFINRIDDNITKELTKLYGPKYNVVIFDQHMYKRYLYDTNKVV